MPDLMADFDAAFAELMKDDAPAAQAPVPPTNTDPTRKPEPEPAPAPEPRTAPEPATGAETQGVQPVPRAGEEPPAAPPAPVAQEPKPAQVTDDELLQRFAAMMRQAEPAPASPQSSPAPAQEPAPAPAQIPAYSQDEIAFLGGFEKEWPDVARAQMLVLRNFGQTLTQHIFREIANNIGPKLALLEELAEMQQLEHLSRVVPDYDATREQVVKWVDTQPGYLQQAYKRVIQEGTADEVVDLINRFRQATGTSSPAPGAAAAPSPAVQTTEPPPAVKKAAAALAPVSSKRSSAPQGEPVTFDDAFERFAKAM
jgi:hypothetical protein